MVLDVKYVPRQVEKLNFHTNLEEKFLGLKGGNFREFFN